MEHYEGKDYIGNKLKTLQTFVTSNTTETIRSNLLIQLMTYQKCNCLHHFDNDSKNFLTLPFGTIKMF